MKYMRRTAGYTWTDYKTNTQITKELKITPILDELLEYNRNCIQHVNRMPRNRLPRAMKHYSTTGRRNHGRPLKRLLDTWDRNGSTSGPTLWQNMMMMMMTTTTRRRRRRTTATATTTCTGRGHLDIKDIEEYPIFMLLTTYIFLVNIFSNKCTSWYNIYIYIYIYNSYMFRHPGAILRELPY